MGPNTFGGLKGGCPPLGWHAEQGLHVSSAAPPPKQVQREQAGLAQERSLLAELRSQRMQEQVGWSLQKLARVSAVPSSLNTTCIAPTSLPRLH